MRRFLFCVALALIVSAGATSASAIEPDVAQLGVVEVRTQRQSAAMTGILGEELPHMEAPVEITSISGAKLAEPGAHGLAGIFQHDAAVGENYATVGYYENFTVRGFTLDLGSAYRVNGFVVPAEFHIPLDNVDSIEILKGIAGLQGGQVSGGGMINFVTKRAEDVRAASTEVDARGGSIVTLDLGRSITGQTGVGFRFVAVHGELRPTQARADGQRDLLSFAVDIRPSRDVRILADLTAQHRSQPAVPGFQLLGGRTLPDSSVRDLNVNRQPWSQPVVNKGLMAGVRAEWQLAPDLWARGGLAQTVARIDDNLATPWGCNSAPFQYFCANGDYVLYKYHAQEQRQTRHATASLHTAIHTGALRHALTAGGEQIERSVQQSDLYSSTSYDASGNALSGNLSSTALPLADPGGTGVNRDPIKATQTAAYFADHMAWGDLRLLASLRSVRIEQQPGEIREHHLLPQFAATWHYAVNRTLYVSHGHGLEFGAEAPLTAANAGAVLAPRLVRQTEIGWKGENSQRFGWSTTLFIMERPYEYTQPVGTSWAGLGDYVRGGQQMHKGIDVTWYTPRSRPFRLEGSQTLIHATVSGSGVYDGVQVQNVPYLSSFVRASLSVPGYSGLDAHLDWVHRGQRNALRDGAVSVPEYDVLNVGLSWRHHLAGYSVTAALTVRNLTDWWYWRDVGEAYSADLLFPGEPRTVAASVRVNW